jgi:ribosome-associated protein
LAITKRPKQSGGGGGKQKSGGDKPTGRPKLRSSHAGAAGALHGGTAKPAARARARKVVEGVSATARRDEDREREPAKPARKKPARSLTDVANSTASDAARELAVLVAIEAIEKKAVGLEILDVAGRVDYADFLVLMSGRSDRHVVALAQGIEEALKKKGQRPISIEGMPHANWVLIDYSDVVVHVFQEDRRHLYNLEGLWMDARRIPIPSDGSPS